MKKKLAIFDMDGTLFDTVPANQAAYAVALAPYGVSLSVEDFALIADLDQALAAE